MGRVDPQPEALAAGAPGMCSGLQPCGRAGCDLSKTRVALRGCKHADGSPFEYRVCALCGAGFVHPLPTEEQVAALYSTEYRYYSEGADELGREVRSPKYRIGGWRYGDLVPGSGFGPVRRWCARFVELAARKTITFSLGIPLALGRDEAMLDFGCGSGLWLCTMRRLGYGRLFGYDLSVNEPVRERLEGDGIRYRTADELLELDSGRFKVVRLEHVFEHLRDPRGTLETIKRILQPGGFLVMTFPSIYPWQRYQDLSTCPGLGYMQIPMHLIHHSKESAVRMVSEAGFEVVGCRVTRRERFITLAGRSS